MKVVITNKATYSREIKYYKESRFEVINPRDSITIENVKDPVAISYYETLISCGFGVEVLHEDKSSADKSSASGTVPEDGIERTVDLSKYSDNELKRVTKNLGISTTYRARWRLESVVTENLPKDRSPEEYL